jgi:scyllo-inositol 2-dehydrogenase (NADP+)
MNKADGGSSPQSLRGAIIGLGRMGLTHLAILNNHPAVSKLSVVESSACFGKAIEKNLGMPYYPTLDQLFRSDLPDFLIVATPTSSHGAIARAALEKGIHTFIEKPLTLSADESAALVQLAASRRVVAQVGYVNRFNEIFQAVQRVLHSGELGAPTHVHCEIRSPMVTKTTGTSWRSQQREGGGCLSDIATHGINLLNFLVGPPECIIGASLQSLVSEAVDDRVDVLFGYEGFTGSLQVNWSDPSCRKPSYRLSIETQMGRIIADHHAYKLFRNTPGRQHSTNSWKTVYITDIAQPVRMYVRGNEFTRQLDYFIDNILSGTTENLSGLTSGLEVDEVIEHIRAVSHEVRTV